MARLMWAMVALILALAGYDLQLHGLRLAGFLLMGVGIGIAVAVAGSLAHDALAGPRERF
jgi:hypothetical protein